MNLVRASSSIFSSCLIWLGLLCAVTQLAACDSKGTGPSSPADQSYVVRARLLSLPAEGSYLQVHHEAIEDFKNREGKVTGMKEMAMEFADLSPEANHAVKSMQPGSAVEIAFEVRWNAEPRMWVTSIRPLGPNEPLKLLKTLEPE